MVDIKTLNKNLKEFPGNKYYRVYIDTKVPHDLSEVSVKLHEITGYYADEYILPVKSVENIFTIISDESTFKGHSCVSLVAVPFTEAKRKIEKCEPLLEELCKEYNLNSIHFSEIIGHNSLGQRQNEFLKRYCDIVSSKNLWVFSMSVNKENFLNKLPFNDVTDSELNFILFWNVMEYMVEELPSDSIFHLNLEQENNLSLSLAENYVRKLYDGVKQCKSLLTRNSSICRHPHFFSKKALLFSSISDLAAYSNNVLQQKLDAKIPISKINKNHNILIDIIRKVFKGYTSLHQSKLGAAKLIV